MLNVSFDAEPAPLSVDLDRSALVIIDMQRDFLESGGFGEALGNDVSRLQAVVGPLKQFLAAFRQHGILVIHTREGHRPDLTDAPPIKVERGDPKNASGQKGRWDAYLCAVSRVMTSSPIFIHWPTSR